MRKYLLILISFFLILVPFVIFAGSQQTSNETAQDVIDDIRRDLHESTTRVYSDTADFVYWIDKAVHIITSQTGCLEATEEIVLSGATMCYTLSTSHYDIKTFHVYDSGIVNSPERFSFIEKAPQNLLTGIPEQEPRPKYCFEFDGKFCVWPVPDSDISGTTVTVYMAFKPSGVTLVTSPIETPEFFDSAIREYVRAEALFKDRQYDKGKTHQEIFYMRLNAYLRDNITVTTEEQR